MKYRIIKVSKKFYPQVFIYSWEYLNSAGNPTPFRGAGYLHDKEAFEPIKLHKAKTLRQDNRVVSEYEFDEV